MRVCPDSYFSESGPTRLFNADVHNFNIPVWFACFFLYIETTLNTKVGNRLLFPKIDLFGHPLLGSTVQRKKDQLFCNSGKLRPRSAALNIYCQIWLSAIALDLSVQPSENTCTAKIYKFIRMCVAGVLIICIQVLKYWLIYTMTCNYLDFKHILIHTL